MTTLPGGLLHHYAALDRDGQDFSVPARVRSSQGVVGADQALSNSSGENRIYSDHGGVAIS
jgi:hypothetical protein